MNNLLNSILQLDQKIFLVINGHHSEIFDSVMTFISAKLSWLPLYAFLLYLIIKYFGKNTIYIVIAVAALVTVSDQLSVLVFKNVFQRLRPCHEESLQTVIHIVNNTCGGKFGFISSHASNTMAVAVFVFLLLRKIYPKYVWIIFLWPLIVSYSRIYLGIHYPGDVLCGMIFGGVLGYLFIIILNRLIPEKLSKS